MLEEIGQHPVASTPPGIDLSIFRCDVDPGTRAPVVGFALRTDPVKAMPVMMEVCDIVHGTRPDVVIACYGRGGEHVPEYVQSAGPLSEAGLRAFYNQCQVFVLPSDFEGWGLPGVEAMACGAALVTTANGGSEEFAVDGANSLVVPRRDPSAIAAAVLRLLADNDLRLRVVRTALHTAAETSIPKAVEALERALLALTIADAVR